MRMRGLFVYVDQEYGLVFVSNETVEEDGNDRKKKNRRRRKKEEQEKDTAALVTPDALTVLGKVQGNLGTCPAMSKEMLQYNRLEKSIERDLFMAPCCCCYFVRHHCHTCKYLQTSAYSTCALRCCVVCACADERLKQFADGQQKLEDEIKKLRVELDEERAKNVLAEKYSPKSSAAHKDGLNGPTSDGLSYEANSKSRGLGQGFGFDVSVHMF